MTNDEALEILRKLVFDGYRLFECGEAWQTLKAAVSEQTAHNTASTPVVKCSCGNDADIFMCDDCWHNQH